jgi:hypothetical protein
VGTGPALSPGHARAGPAARVYADKGTFGMNKGERGPRVVFLSVLVVLLTGCGPDNPTPTTVPLAATPTLIAPTATAEAPTATPQQNKFAPTATPVPPRATPTPIPPTATPTVNPLQAAIYSSTGAGGAICRATAPPNTPCENVPASESPTAVAYAGDLLQTRPAGTLAAQTRSARLRLLPDAQLRLVQRADLTAGERFLLEAGGGLFNHTNGAGEVEIDAGGFVVRPIDTQFSINVTKAGVVRVAVNQGAQGVVVTGTNGIINVGAGMQMQGEIGGTLEPSEPMDAETQRIWSIYGIDATLQVAPDVLARPSACAGRNQLYPDADAYTQLGCAVGQATRYDEQDAVPGPTAWYNGGVLLYDQRQATVYALFLNRAQRTTRVANTPLLWVSFSAQQGETLDAWEARHADVTARLNGPVMSCPAGTWALQRFTRGTVIEPPARDSCSASLPARALLATDGTWTVWNAPATPTPRPGIIIRPGRLLTPFVPRAIATQVAPTPDMATVMPGAEPAVAAPDATIPAAVPTTPPGLATATP